MLILVASLAGLTVALFVIGGAGAVRSQWARDAEWIRVTANRFRPEPIDVRRWTVVYYAARFAALVLCLFVMPSMVAALIVWILLLLVPKYFVEILWHQRRQKIDQQLPDVIAAMANSLRAGVSTVQAIQRLGDKAPEPIRSELRVMSNQWAHGATLESVMSDAKARLGLPNFTLFASAVLVNREMGGDIVRVFDRLATSMRKHEQMRRAVKSATAEGRTNIKMLMCAPVLMLLVLAGINPEGVELLFGTLPGLVVLTIGLGLAGLGVYWGMRIVRSEV